MTEFQRGCLCFFIAILLASLGSPSFADELRYSWMLPKTVIDTTVVYTFEGCTDSDSGANLKVKMTPTLVGRPVADIYVGRRGINLAQLKSIWQDRNISVQTFTGSHILQSIGSAPVGQVGQIVGNILGGITKLVAVGLGVGAEAAPPPPGAKSKCGAANDTAQKIKSLQQTMRNLQTELANGSDDATQKKDTAEIQAIQSLVSALQTDLTITIKETIDPGYSPININDGSTVAVMSRQAPKAIGADGLIATFKLSPEQLTVAKWYDNANNVSAKEQSLLSVNVYLDFPNAYIPVAPQEGVVQQTKVEAGDIYRDVAYIPVLVWRGDRQADAGGAMSGEAPYQPVQLIPAQPLPFAQYGAAQSLPFSTSAFGNLNWTVSFLESGEVTNAVFAAKATGVAATNLFGTAASAVNSIAGEVRTATSAATQATAVQSEADLIYEKNRLQLCQESSASCPSK
jgi:hypothetical protein